MRTYIFMAVLIVLVGCKSADTGVSEFETQQTKTLIESNNYELTMTWATPMANNAMNQISNANLLPLDSRTGRINLQGSSSYIRTKGDSVQVYLPYFGTRQLSITPGDTNGAIQFEGLPERYEVEYNDKKRLTDIYIRVKDRTEQYDVNIKVFGNRNANVYVNSTHRTSIRYTGKLSTLQEN